MLCDDELFIPCSPSWVKAHSSAPGYGCRSTRFGSHSLLESAAECSAVLSAWRSAQSASGKTGCCIWGGNTHLTKWLLTHQDHFKRSLEFVQIRRFVPKDNYLDFDLFFFFPLICSIFFSFMFNSTWSSLLFSQRLGCVRVSIKLAAAEITPHCCSSAHSARVTL